MEKEKTTNIQDRIPKAFTNFLQAIWEDKFRHIIREHLSFEEQSPLFILALEHLVQTGKVKQDSNIFNDKGQMRPNIDKQDLDRFVGKKPLKNLKVCSIGGLESVPFSSLGASSLAVYPSPLNSQSRAANHLPILYTPEIAGKAIATASQDLILSFNMFDPDGPWVPEAEQAFLRIIALPGLLDSMFELTKPGGLSVHGGRLVKDLPPYLKTKVTTREIAHIKGLTSILVLQKAG